MIVSMLQYIPPNGRKKWVDCEVPDDLSEKYKELTQEGCNIAIEILMTGELSITVEDDIHDFDIEVVPNAPPHGQVALEAMIARFDVEKYRVSRRIEEGEEDRD